MFSKTDKKNEMHLLINILYWISTMLYEAFPAETRLTVYRGAPVDTSNQLEVDRGKYFAVERRSTRG